MKIKRKAIHAELRKTSKTFDGWLKYEVLIENPDGSREKVPAYGRDLQDALSRVVHDDKVKKILPKIEKVPAWLWVLLWFGVITYVTVEINNHQEALSDWVGLIYVGSISAMTLLTITISNWFKLRNRNR